VPHDLGARCRRCRREGVKLFLKGDRCYSAKCAMERRQSAPGMHTDRRRKPTDYALQLREKQRMKRLYGLYEAQFRRFLGTAERQAGNTGENLLRLLERRLDNIAVRSGFAPSHAAARELICHGHVRVNGGKVDVPSYLVKAGDEVTVVTPAIKERVQAGAKVIAGRNAVPGWLEVSVDDLKATVRMLPSKGDINIPVDEGLVVTFYSK
jgi:small subunit ribosomal protein S4